MAHFRLYSQGILPFSSSSCVIPQDSYGKIALGLSPLDEGLNLVPNLFSLLLLQTTEDDITFISAVSITTILLLNVSEFS